jgi:cysteinyl-tRNA synthetase
MFARILFFISLFVFVSCRISYGIENLTPFVFDNFAYVINGASIEELRRSDFDLLIIDYSFDGSQQNAYSAAQISSLKEAGHTPIAYLSIGEAEDYRFYWNNDWYRNPPDWLGPENPNWEGNYKVKYWYTEWENIIKEYITRIIAQSFDGVYLDVVDAFYYWGAETVAVPMDFAAEKMIELVVGLYNYAKQTARGDFYLFIQNGLDIFDFDYQNKLSKALTGVGVESLFFLPDKNPSEDTDYRLSYLTELRLQKKRVLVIDYLYENPPDLSIINTFISRCYSYGFFPYVADQDQTLSTLVEIEGIQP